MIYSAVHLKRYCAQFGVPLPAEVRLLYEASKWGEVASISMAGTAPDLRRGNLPVQPTPSIGRQAEARLSTPSGTVTFLFTDIDGSTRLWEQYPQAMKAALARHDAILHGAIEAHHGRIIKTTGDGILAAFEAAANGLAAALAAQRALLAQKWEAIAPQGLRVRMGVHTGEVETRAGDYYGPAVNRAARLMSIGYGGQILLSATTADLARDQLPMGASLRDLGEHGLKDLARSERVYHLVHPDLPAEFPPLKSLNVFTNNLPVQVTSFIGRQAQVKAVKDLLMRDPPGVRLLTLTGPGGIGKTRLALHVGAALADHFASGVCFVPLEPISDPALVVPAIAQALRIRDSGGQPLLDSLKDYLQQKHLLLLLDNFEQVASAAPVVADLLAAPRLQVLVTSRALLRLRGEHEFVAPPLSLPDRTHLPPPDRLGQVEAVQLFVQRARAARADFVLTDANAPDVAEICHRLDGLPLAIELAAARVKLLPPQTLLARLSSRLQLLTSGARDLPARQQTLRNTIDWSYQLLHGDEQTLFARLGVFVGGCTIEAAEAVCNIGRNLDVLEGVASLINKSLLQHEETPDGQLRVGMLATIREYANERLLKSGEADAIQGQHANFFLGLAETAANQVNTAEGRLWMDRLEMERDNLGAALTWCLAARDRADTLGRLMAALNWFWYRRGHLSEGREWAERALALTTDGDRTPLRGHALYVSGLMAMWQGDLDVARRRLDKSLEIWRNLEEAPRLASTLIGRGVVSAFQGDVVAAHPFFEESLAVGRALGDQSLAADALMCLGVAAMGLGDYGTARAQLEEAVREARQAKDEWIVANSLNNLGEVARCLGDYEHAGVYYEVSGAMFRDIGDKSDFARSIHNLGYVAQHQGDPGRAATLFEESLSMFRELDNKRGIAECVLGLASVAAGQGRPERAARLVGASETILDSGRAGRWPADRVEYDRTVETARTVLGEAAFAAAWAEGRAMTLEQAVAYALEEVESS